jgi:pimeloyl-ACP methyl ester carboxylesterase
MTVDAAAHESTRTVAGVELEVFSGGRGEPLLVLHDYEFLNGWWPFMDALAERFGVLAPSHPGFGHSPDASSVDSVDDLAYLYLDLLAEGNLRDAVVIGSSLGGWIAAEMAVRSTERLRGLVLVAPLGIKIGDRETRDIPDIFALPPDEVVRLYYRDPARMALDYTRLSDDELTAIARNREATALYAWEPYFHNPKLPGRLHRVDVPTLLLWGADDQFVSAGYYGAAYQRAIPGARLETIAEAGHFPHLEQPVAVVEHIQKFLAARRT